ncbi:MAG: uncharacterized protein A8A55_2685, partial [Amphiamblys sp. WSBS2006]
MCADLVELFKKIGLNEKKACEAAKNKKLSANIREIEKLVSLDGCTKEVGYLVYLFSSKRAKETPWDRLILENILSKKISTEKQVKKAVEHATIYAEIDEERFKKACGIDIAVSDEEIRAAVKEHVEKSGSEFNPEEVLKEIKNDDRMAWASSRRLKELFDEELGGKCFSSTKKRKEKGAYMKGEAGVFHRPGENPQLSEEIRQKHLEATQ